MSYAIAFIILIYSSSSTTLKIPTITKLNETLPDNMWGFCAGFYDKTYSIINGYYQMGTYTSVTLAEWISYNYTQINLPKGMGCCTYDSQTCSQTFAEPTLYGVPENGKYLFIYDLQHQFYHNISYNYTLPIIAPGSCVIASDNDIVYVIGGGSSSVLKNTQAYNVTENTWMQKAKMWTGRTWHGCALFESEVIYVFGGYPGYPNSGSNLKSIEKYDISSNTWKQLSATLHRARNSLNCQYFNAYIFCLGGYDAAYPTLVEVFNPVDESMMNWNISLHKGRTRFQVVKTNKSLIIMGGQYASTSMEELTFYAPTPSPTTLIDSSLFWILVPSIGGGLCILLFGIVGCYMYRKKKKDKKDMQYVDLKHSIQSQ